MRRVTKSVAVHCAAWVALLAGERLVAHLLAHEDLLAELLLGQSPGWLLALAALYLLRFAVLFVLPGWVVLYVLATARRQSCAGSGSAGGRRQGANRLGTARRTSS